MQKLKANGIKFLMLVNAVCLVILVLSNLAGQFNPAVWWPFSIAGLLFPILLLIAFVSGIFWLFVKPKVSLFCLAAILLSFPNIRVSLPLHFSSAAAPKEPGNLRIVSWNVNLMNYSAKETETAIEQNEKIFSTLRHLNADIICLQEFFTAVIPDSTYNFIDSLRNSMGYNYAYFSRDYPKFDRKFFSGTLICSKYKIIDSSRSVFPHPIPGSILKTSIIFNHDTIDIVSTHLQNINFGRDANNAMADSSFAGVAVPSWPTKLKYGYADQVKQVKVLQQVLDTCVRPAIFAGDLNDVPTSYSYRNTKRNMQDVWLQKGSGLGATFPFVIPTLRIDYIFAHKDFKVKQASRILSDASDHFGVVTDVQLLKKD